MSKLKDQVKKLDSLWEEQSKLREEFTISTLIQELWPQAFSSGKAQCTLLDFKGVPIRKKTTYPGSTRPKHLRITAGNGEVRSFPTCLVSERVCLDVADKMGLILHWSVVKEFSDE